MTPSIKPRALDLGCGAGGATKGLQRAGFHVTGVDINPQPRYCGDDFIQADMLDVSLSGFDLIWAGPPCQGYSKAMKHLAHAQPLLIPALRERLASKPLYVIENVPGAPLQTPYMLCGLMFGRAIYRHRLFETSWPLIETPNHFDHRARASAAGHFEEETFISVAGHCSPISLAEAVMDIYWMSREELAESIPPYFSEFIGRQAIRLIETEAVCRECESAVDRCRC